MNICIQPWMILLIMLAHYVGDFVLQTDWMAQNKSKAFWPLVSHGCVYALPFIVLGIPFLLVTAGLHIIVDAVTSRINSRLYAAGKIGAFFKGIGADQFIHACALFGTYAYLYNQSMLWIS